MKHGFIKVAVASPRVTVADCAANLQKIKDTALAAYKDGVKILVFPELSLTGYTCSDLFYSEVLLSRAREALAEYVETSCTDDMISIIGLPLLVNDKIYNCAAICQNKQILGIVPKSNIPNYAEFYEARQFTPFKGETQYVTVGSQTVPFGNRQIFVCSNMPGLKLGVEICEDIWVIVPPSCGLTQAGATVIANLSASNETIGKDAYRELLVRSQSARTVCGYIYADCFEGESTTDIVFGGHSIIAENGTVLKERRPFDASQGDFICTELDIGRILFDRRKMNTYHADEDGTYLYTDFTLKPCVTKLTRKFERFPFVPSDAGERSKRCETILSIQSQGLKQRIEKAHAKKCVVGISGGLDSCLAMLVAVRAMDSLGRPRSDVIGVTMPCFGTTARTKSNAEILCAELGVDFKCVNITESVRRHFEDIGHDENNRNVVYENCQARERTQVLMDIANMSDGVVIGTGDLSELALGWATYNGDHMSMYGVNASVPKTLVRHIVSYCADKADAEGDAALASVLRDILNTPVSPELLPADSNGEIAQRTEDIVGPYEIHDFYLYNMLRFGFAPDKLFRMAKSAFSGTYDDATLLKWLKNFIRRFFAQQFKRSCLPDGPKVGSVALSPRGDWRMPSDASCDEWMKIADKIKID